MLKHITIFLLVKFFICRSELGKSPALGNKCTAAETRAKCRAGIEPRPEGRRAYFLIFPSLAQIILSSYTHHPFIFLLHLSLLYILPDLSLFSLYPLAKKTKMANISPTLYTNRFLGSVFKSPIQMGSLSVNNSVKNISRFGTFNLLYHPNFFLSKLPSPTTIPPHNPCYFLSSFVMMVC